MLPPLRSTSSSPGSTTGSRGCTMTHVGPVSAQFDSLTTVSRNDRVTARA